MLRASEREHLRPEHRRVKAPEHRRAAAEVVGVAEAVEGPRLRPRLEPRT
jgi:hypothetical protein